MSTVSSRALALLTAAAIAVGTSACGSASAPPASSSSRTSAASDSSGSATTDASSGATPSVKELYAQSRKSALAAKSAHVKGSVADNGQKVTIDIAGTVDGSNQRLVMSIGSLGKITIITSAGKIYFKADKKFWTKNAGSAASKVLGGKWVQMSAAQASDLGDTNISSLLKEMYSDDSLSVLDTLTTKVETGTVAGVPAYILTDRVKKEGELDVTADGKALPLRITTTGADGGTVTFSQWNTVRKFSAPPAGQVIKI